MKKITKKETATCVAVSDRRFGIGASAWKQNVGTEATMVLTDKPFYVKRFAFFQMQVGAWCNWRMSVWKPKGAGSTPVASNLLTNKLLRIHIKLLTIILLACAIGHIPSLDVLAQSQVRINEAATEETSPDHDWVELFVASNSLNLSGWKFYEQSTLVKTFPSSNFTFSSATFIVLHFNSSDPDETNLTGDTNGNGFVDIYTSDSGLTGTSNVLTLRNKSGLIIDAVVYSDHSSWTSGQQTAFNLAVSSGQWTGTQNGGSAINFDESVDVPGGIGEGNSIQRDRQSTDSDNQNNAKQDWVFIKRNQTMGKTNFSLTNCSPASGGVKACITEVAPSIPSSAGGDFIEIFFSQNINLCGLKLYQGASLIKTFPSVTPGFGSFGKFIIFHAGVKSSVTNPDETDTMGDLNSNGVIDLYSDDTSPGLYGSVSSNITLKSADNAVLDFVSWTHSSSDDYNPTLRDQYDFAVSTGKWAPFCDSDNINCYLTGSISWPNSTTQSLSKKFSPDIPLTASRPSFATDWFIAAPTPGLESRSFNRRQQEKLLEIAQSPFSPYGDHPRNFNESILTYRADLGSAVTIRIFNIQGQTVRTLLDHAIVSETDDSTVRWNGKDSKNQIVPMGIYPVHIEVEKPDSGKETDSKIIVVGRKL